MNLPRACACLALLLVGGESLAQTEDATTSVATPKFAVVTGKGRGAPNLKRAVAKNVERRLKVFGDQVSLKEFRKTARDNGIRRPKDLSTVATARTVGTKLALTHVIIISSFREREQVGKRKKNVFYAEVSVVDMASGDVTFTDRFALAGRRLNLGIGVDIVEAVGAALKPPEPPEEDENLALAPPPPPPPADGALAADPNAEAPLPPEPPGEPVPPSETQPEPQPTPSGLGEDPSVGTEFEPRRRGGKARPGLILLAGFGYNERDGAVSGINVTEDIDYDGPIASVDLELGVFPLAFDGRGDSIEGLGFYARGSYAQVTTEFDPSDTSRTVDSNVYGAEGGLALRLPFGDSLLDPEVMVVLGYAYWQFPLSDGVFPGTKYEGFYTQLNLTVPFIEEFAFVLDGGMIPFLDTDGRTKRLGDFDSGFAFNVNSGFRLWFDPFDIRLVGHYRRYDASYTGPTRLGLINELVDAELSDTYFGGSLMVGVSL